jgi:DNA polymerase III delta prime subunit
MANYDFLNLSYIDFEDLVRDLFSINYNIEFESFSQGKDKGIDLRFISDKNIKWIVQCKRYTDFNDLFSSLKSEFKKVIKLKPDRYSIVTSVPLNPSKKEKIYNLFSNIIQNPSDIIGKEGLNALLTKFPEVEKVHFKLWLSSVNLLSSILHSGIFNKSQFQSEDLNKCIRIYVQNKSFKKAFKILDENNYVLITGIPGIGKSTLAKILISYLMKKKYKLKVISEDIDEAWKVLSNNEKEFQIFYYDDFLGSNSLEGFITKNEDQRLIDFIKKLKNSEFKSKKLILTTRDYILRRAKHEFEKLKNSNIEIAACKVDIKDYDLFMKAKIFYNHLFFSKIDRSYFNVILDKQNYLEIVKHENYNPRIIEFITDKDKIKLEKISPIKYFQWIIDKLDNPQDIWDGLFNKLPEVAKYILFVILIIGEGNSENYMNNIFNNVIQSESLKFRFSYNRHDLSRSIIELEKTFITQIEDKLHFINPSVKDYLIGKLKGNNDLIISVIKNTFVLDQFLNVHSLKDVKNKIIYNEEVNSFMNEFIIDNYTKFLEINTLDRIFQIVLFLNKVNEKLYNFLYLEYEKLDYKQIEVDNYSTGNYFYLLNYFRSKIEEDKLLQILEHFYNTINNLDGLTKILELNEFFPEQIGEIGDSYESIDKLTKEIIETEITDAYDTESMENILAGLDEIENKTKVNLEPFRQSLYQKISDDEDEDAENSKSNSLNSYSSKSFDKTHNVDDEIAHLFDSLKSI